MLIKECPFCGSIRIVETLKGNTSICLACESILNDKSKPTVFDRITASPEVLAEKFVFSMLLVPPYRLDITEVFYSTIKPGEKFYTKQQAIAATVMRLKEVE